MVHCTCCNKSFSYNGQGFNQIKQHFVRTPHITSWKLQQENMKLLLSKEELRVVSSSTEHNVSLEDRKYHYQVS